MKTIAIMGKIKILELTPGPSLGKRGEKSLSPLLFVREGGWGMSSSRL